jgi:hypothetical protein
VTATRTLDLDTLTLARGVHVDHTAMCVMEAVAFIAGEPWSDAPRCASRVLTVFLQRLNDRLSDADRQKLKPLIPKLIGTAAASDIEDRRALLAVDYAFRTAVPYWMDLAGFSERAAAIRSRTVITTRDQVAGMLPIIRRARDDIYVKRKALCEDLGKRIASEIKSNLRKKLSASDSAIASDIAIAIASDIAIAIDIAIARAIASAIAIDIASDSASDIAIARAIAIDIASDSAIASASAIAIDIASDSASDIAIARAIAIDIASDSAIASASAIAIASASDSASAIARSKIWDIVYRAVRDAFYAKVFPLIEERNGKAVDDLVALAERMIEVAEVEQ